jgi:hypothetical protein
VNNYTHTHTHTRARAHTATYSNKAMHAKASSAVASKHHSRPVSSDNGLPYSDFGVPSGPGPVDFHDASLSPSELSRKSCITSAPPSSPCSSADPSDSLSDTAVSLRGPRSPDDGMTVGSAVVGVAATAAAAANRTRSDVTAAGDVARSRTGRDKTPPSSSSVDSEPSVVECESDDRAVPVP